MVFRKILGDLLSAVDGAIAAVLLDYEGESVELETTRDRSTHAEEVKVIGAYQGIFLLQLQRLCAELGTGRPDRFKFDFVNAKVMNLDLGEGYYLVLVVEPGTLEAFAWHRLERCRDELHREMWG